MLALCINATPCPIMGLITGSITKTTDYTDETDEHRLGGRGVRNLCLDFTPLGRHH
jgi:hypothetical protein